MKNVFLALCLFGVLLPSSQFVPWFLDHGPDIRLFFEELFSTKIGVFFGMDVIVSAVVLFAFIFQEGRRLEMRRLWISVLATLSAGVSFACPTSSGRRLCFAASCWLRRGTGRSCLLFLWRVRGGLRLFRRPISGRV